jgi:hypothetical protein
MASECIAVAPEALALLEQRLRALPVKWSTAQLIDLSGAPEVKKEYDHVWNSWSDARSKLDDALGQLADVVKAVRETFVAVDRELSSGLGGDEPLTY